MLKYLKVIEYNIIDMLSAPTVVRKNQLQRQNLC